MRFYTRVLVPERQCLVSRINFHYLAMSWLETRLPLDVDRDISIRLAVGLASG